MKRRIYISDLDGTLLNDSAELSHFSRRNLNRLIKKGLNFTIASARSIISIQQMLKGLKIKLPIIEFNGAYISDFETGEHIQINEISPKIKEKIFFDILESYQFPIISSFDGTRDSLYYVDTLNEGSQWYINNRITTHDIRLKKISSLEPILDEHVVCITIIDKKEKLEKLRVDLKKGYGEMIELHLNENSYSPGWYWLTIYDAKATKDKAIKKLKKMTSHMSCDLIVFGDSINDIKMFKEATVAIAVSNAKEIVKKYADLIIGSNNEDSVIKYLLKNF